jgi:RHS repeat-associated protein
MGYLGAQERRADPGSGLIQMGERSYSPSLGNILSEDPVAGHLGIGVSVDRYLYVWDNPLNRYDLNGRDVCVPSPFGSACAGSGLEDVATAVNEDVNTAEHVIDTVGSDVGSGLEPAWNWTAPGRIWIADRASDFWKEYGSPIESVYVFAGANWQYCREGAKTLAPGGAVVGALFGPEGIPAGGYVGGVAGCLGAAGTGIALSAE